MENEFQNGKEIAKEKVEQSALTDKKEEEEEESKKDLTKKDKKDLENNDEEELSKKKLWFKDCEKKIEEIEERFGQSRYSEVIAHHYITPFYHYMNQEKITPKQRDYLIELAEGYKSEFFAWCEKRENISSIGEIGDRIEEISKKTASEAIEYLKGL